jgi:1-acyl-sn-glycerol-3-phosphate acyltransferase
MSQAVRRALDSLIGWFSPLVLGIYFRRIEIMGRERIPEPPFLVVVNHVNGSIDPMLVLGPLRIPDRILAQSTLWRIPVLGQLLALAGAIPVYRRQDPEGGPAQNQESLARAAEELAKGGIVAIFPEGVSHNLPHLAPLRTGAARLALLAAQLMGNPVRVVPVGLLSEARHRFRSSVLVVVGDTLEVEAQGTDLDSPGVREVTRQVEAALQRVTVNYESWEEAHTLELGAEILARPTAFLPSRRSLSEVLALRKALLASFRELQRVQPAEAEELLRFVRFYQETLRTFGLEDRQVVWKWPLLLEVRFVLRTLARILVVLPLALLGVGLNLIPYAVIDAFSRLVRDQRDQVATFQVVPSLVAYPLTWFAWGIVAARAFGQVAVGIAVSFSGPFLGYVALLAHERWTKRVTETRAFLRLAWRRQAARELFRRREEVEHRLGKLLGRGRNLQGSSAQGLSF